MNVSKYDIIRIRDRASDNIRDFQIPAYYSDNSEIGHYDKVAISWIKAVSSQLDLGLEIEIKEKRG